MKHKVRGSRSRSPARGIAVRDLTPADWPVLERLFGSNGACGGCWCMHFRVPRGGKLWEEVKGEKNRRAFRRLVMQGKAHGCLAFHESEPVGWCSVDRRSDFPRMRSSRVLASDWDEHTWSVACFYVPRAWAGRGVASKLLAHAVDLARRSGAGRLEGYPLVPRTDEPIPAAFAHTGIVQMFERAGFTDVTPHGRSRPIYVKRLRPRRETRQRSDGA